MTSEVFDTEITRIIDKDAKHVKKTDWEFNWHKELKDEKTKETYKLTTVNNPLIIQGLLSIEDKQDHIFMHLIESARFNKGKTRCITVFLEILSLTHAKFLSIKAMKVS